MATRRYFEFVEGPSSKFWEVWCEGTQVFTRYGRIGASGQTSVKDEGSSEKGHKLLDKLVREKTGKGYLEQGGGAAPTAPPTAITAAPAVPTAPRAAAPATPAGPPRVARWTAGSRKRLHGVHVPHKFDPPDVALSLEDAWTHLQARYHHLVHSIMEPGHPPTGTGPFAAHVGAITAEMAAASPPTSLDPTRELCRAALLEMTARDSAGTWSGWSYARALVSFWMHQSGIDLVHAVLTHPTVFRIDEGASPGCMNGAFNACDFTRPPLDPEGGLAHPRVLCLEAPPPKGPYLLGYLEGKKVTSKVPVSQCEHTDAHKRAHPGPAFHMTNECFFYSLGDEVEHYAWALRGFVSQLPPVEFGAARARWQRLVQQTPVRFDPTDVTGAFVFSRDADLVHAVVTATLASDPVGGAFSSPTGRDSWMMLALLVVADAADAARIAQKFGCYPGSYCFDLVERLDADAGPILEGILESLRTSAKYVTKECRDALKLLGK